MYLNEPFVNLIYIGLEKRNNSMKYKVTLNWHGELHVFYTVAKGTKQALNNATHQLATTMNKTPYSMRQYFKTKQNSYSMKEVIKDD